MHFDKRCEEALQHLERASAFLHGPEPKGGEDQAPEELETEGEEPGRRAALDHIAAARRELKGLQEKARQEEDLQGETSRGKSGDGCAPDQNGTGRPTTSKLASRAMGLLTILLHQIGETKKVLEPLRPSGNEKPPVQRFREADLEAVLSALRRLRRPASGMEANLRQLKNRLREGGTPPT